MHWQTTVQLAGSRATPRFARTPEFLAAQQGWEPWTVLGGGLAFIWVTLNLFHRGCLLNMTTVCAEGIWRG